MHTEFKTDSLRKATTLEWQASIFGACFIAFGLGVLAASYFRSWTLWIIVLGVISHSWGMYKIHQRNK
jgi:hypothetical protein